jgi:hypothetical protein
MYCMALKVYTCQEAASGPKTFSNMFCKLLQQNEPSPAWQWSWFQYQLTLMCMHAFFDDLLTLRKKSAKWYLICGIPQYENSIPRSNWSAELGKRVKSSSRHFTTSGPVWCVIYFWRVTLQVCNIYRYAANCLDLNLSCVNWGHCNGLNDTRFSWHYTFKQLRYKFRFYIM